MSLSAVRACTICILLAASVAMASDTPQMYYADSEFGTPFAKDPDVVHFQGRYLMYYTMRMPQGFAIGIAQSHDLVGWTKVASVLPEAPYEKRGLCAPAAIMLDGQVHLFYQTYGNLRNDAICHAVSDDGVHFKRNPTNPIFRPTGDWNCGRAIDAEVIPDGDTMWLYCATRDPKMRIQMLAVAAAPVDSGFVRSAWTQRCDQPILKPELPWETRCIEAPALIKHDGRFFMFYAGGYNNDPQQIGVAASDDGLTWKRLSNRPLLPNGGPDDWNASESGHPGVFADDDGQAYLFFQGNRTNGKNWYLSKMRIEWSDDDLPYLVRPRDNVEFHLSAEGAP